MIPLARLESDVARRLRGVVVDLDDTLLDHGALGEAAYGALFRLRESGLRLVACTGRPALWAELALRQWPIDAAIAENGPVAFVREVASGAGLERVIAVGSRSPVERAERRSRLLSLARELVDAFPETMLADDNAARATDVTLDIGEHRSVAAPRVAAMRSLAEMRGARTSTSSIHMHLSEDAEDKATGALRLLTKHFGEDSTGARFTHAFIGDSGNDAAAFACFAVTFGVANVRHHLARFSMPPRYVASRERGSGFAEIADRIVALRRD